MPPETDATRNKEYFIQVGAWKHAKYAQEIFKKLKNYYPEVIIVKENDFHKVRIPGIMTKKQGTFILEEIKEEFDLEPILLLKK